MAPPPSRLTCSAENSPGRGVGGHCIPIDPNYLSHNVQARLGYPFRFVELAQEINASMPVYVVQRVQDMLNAERLPLNGATVLLLGVTYKPASPISASPPSARQAPGREGGHHQRPRPCSHPVPPSSGCDRQRPRL